jgi:hypothetical protein
LAVFSIRGSTTGTADMTVCTDSNGNKVKDVLHVSTIKNSITVISALPYNGVYNSNAVKYGDTIKEVFTI